MPEWRAGRLVWSFDEVLWGEQRCHHCLFRNLVELLVDDEPMCLDCAGLLVERAAAVAIAPALRELLPPVWER